jgi:carbonic anhydrase
VITCLDPRVDPADFLGLELSDAIVVRNVGGRVTSEVINDVAFLDQIAENVLPDGPLFEVAVIHHTQRGAGALADDAFRRRYAERIGAEESTLRERAILDPAATVMGDVERLRSAPAISPRITVSGHVYDVVTGLVETILSADQETKVEQPQATTRRRNAMTTAVPPELESDQETGATTVATHNGTSSPRETAGVIAPPPLIYLGALGVGFALDAVIGSGSLPWSVAVPVGAASIVAGFALLASFLSAFQRAQTPVDPYTPTETIVTDGPYRLTRNPAYLGMALIYAGIAIGSDSLWALVPLPVAIAIIDRGVIAREERYLERKFGRPYLDYKRRVRRWI